MQMGKNKTKLTKTKPALSLGEFAGTHTRPSTSALGGQVVLVMATLKIW